MQTCLHRLRLDADELRRLLDTHAFDEAGDEHGAEGFRQRVDGALEQHADFALSHGRFRIEYASVTCWAIHSALGCAATPSHRRRLRSCRRTSNPYSSRNEIVGTTKRSIEARNLPRDLCGGKPCLGHLSDRLAANKDSVSLIIRCAAGACIAVKR